MPPVSAPAPAHSVSFADALRVWLSIGLNSFGGPAGQIAVMHRVLVDEKRWISEARFLHALNYCMLLPGPEAQQLATYIGWLLHGVPGGLAAGGLFVLPGALAVMALSALYAGYAGVGLVGAAFFGLKAAVLAVVVEAVLRIGKRALRDRARVVVAALSFVGIFFFGLPFPLIVLLAALAGLLGSYLVPGWPEAPASAPGGGAVVDTLLDDGVVVAPSVWSTLRTAGIWLLIWLGPLALISMWLGPESVYTRLGVFFSKAAVVTFGGAYAVLAYIGQQAVERFGWLSPGEMLDGLGLAETTPGPLILVVQYVGFLAAYRNPGALPPMLAGVLGASLTLWVTFAPCFLWIFAGAPTIEWLRGRTALTAALSTITAAVVGVVLNLAVWFALHVVFGELRVQEGALGFRMLVPVWSSVDPAAAAIAVGAMVGMLRFHTRMLPTLGVSALAGVVWWWVG